ncbi:MAG: TRAM domain-containing protein [Parachlamydiaceae bacterium]|nr:TRAM domain-containing protein [Parachlamydiaceae bacterium]
MQISLTFIRILFFSLCVLFFATFTTARASDSSYFTNLALGIVSGAAFGAALIGIETFFKRFNLRVFNIAALGLFFGYVMGEALLLLTHSALDITNTQISLEALMLIRIGIFLFAAYLGMTLTARASEELYISIPFVKFKPSSNKKKDHIIDTSILLDSRIIDLAASGLLDHQLILPHFILKELYDSAETGDETIKSKARRCAEVVKKLENIPTLGLRYADLDFPEIKDSMCKLVKLARLLDANIFTGDTNRVQQSTLEGIRVINLNMLSIALKPLAQTGEFINIKIQRYGKEARQGIGYLEDGTMVVVNGGAEFIGEIIRAQVLSVKHTSSGRMIFCNAIEDHLTDSNLIATSDDDDDARNWSVTGLNTL